MLGLAESSSTNRSGEKGETMIKKEYMKICKRFDDVMNFIGCEYLMIAEGEGEVYGDRRHYNVQNGITLQWMADEAAYWLSCYYEPGHCRCDDKHDGREGYKIWLAETGRLKRLLKALKKFGDLNVCVEETA